MICLTQRPNPTFSIYPVIENIKMVFLNVEQIDIHKNVTLE